MPDYDDVIANTLISNINTRVLKDYLSKWKDHCKEENAKRRIRERDRERYHQRHDPLRRRAKLYRCNSKELKALLKKGKK